MKKPLTEYYRIVGFIEAVSFLVLLFIAMPMKYAGDMPHAVRIVGMIHGVLFSAFALGGLSLMEDLRWSYRKLFLALLVATLPFGPFIFDRWLFGDRGIKACRLHPESAESSI